MRKIVMIGEFDCNKSKYRSIELKNYALKRGQGAVTSEIQAPDSSFEKIENENWASGIFNVACAYKLKL